MALHVRNQPEGNSCPKQATHERTSRSQDGAVHAASAGNIRPIFHEHHGPAAHGVTQPRGSLEQVGTVSAPVPQHDGCHASPQRGVQRLLHAVLEDLCARHDEPERRYLYARLALASWEQARWRIGGLGSSSEHPHLLLPLRCLCVSQLRGEAGDALRRVASACWRSGYGAMHPAGLLVLQRQPVHCDNSLDLLAAARTPQAAYAHDKYPACSLSALAEGLQSFHARASGRHLS